MPSKQAKAQAARPPLAKPKRRVNRLDMATPVIIRAGAVPANPRAVFEAMARLREAVEGSNAK